MTVATLRTEPPTVVSREEWIEARKAHLKKEKEHTLQHDRLLEERRGLPWVKIDKEYVFDGPEGKVSLADLFEGRSQLIVYHFMLGPGWEEGCPSCSFVSDHAEAARMHFENHDVKYATVSRAPIDEIEAFKKRMGWKFNWVSAFESDFNQDFHVSFTEEELAGGEAYYNYEKTEELSGTEWPGLSVFVKDANGDVFHTYSTYTRGLDILLGAHNYLDMTPKGRNEKSTMDWVRHHDKYENAETGNCCH